MPLTNRMREYENLVNKYNQYNKKSVKNESYLKYSKKLKNANKVNNNIIIQLEQLQYFYNKKLRNIKKRLGEKKKTQSGDEEKKENTIRR